jgi:hypothetical protein
MTNAQFAHAVESFQVEMLLLEVVDKDVFQVRYVSF